MPLVKVFLQAKPTQTRAAEMVARIQAVVMSHFKVPASVVTITIVTVEASSFPLIFDMRAKRLPGRTQEVMDAFNAKMAAVVQNEWGFAQYKIREELADPTIIHGCAAL
jgi:phenylpyruvate tautomerase PptA (4-oxalocrotonate tautomerase family)